MKQKAFTLAEIMIVLSVIAIITTILLPSARNATPNEDLMKFKKGHLAFVNVINELVSSEKYYLNGDLGIRPNNVLIDGTHDGDNTYFCETFADVLGNVKEKDCQNTKGSYYGYVIDNPFDDSVYNNFARAQREFDSICNKYQTGAYLPDITTVDGISYYQTSPQCPFAVSYRTFNIVMWGNDDSCMSIGEWHCNRRLFGEVEDDLMGFQKTYKGFCMDIDGFNQGEDPFGYGVRHDGKIIYGIRASEWFKKTIQEK